MFYSVGKVCFKRIERNLSSLNNCVWEHSVCAASFERLEIILVYSIRFSKKVFSFYWFPWNISLFFLFPSLLARVSLQVMFSFYDGCRAQSPWKKIEIFYFFSVRLDKSSLFISAGLYTNSWQGNCVIQMSDPSENEGAGLAVSRLLSCMMSESRKWCCVSQQHSFSQIRVIW